MKRITSLLILIILFWSFQRKGPAWVAIGDSITYLNDHQNETGNRITKGYLTLIGEQFPELEIINKGYNGWTAIRIAEQFQNLEIPKAEIYSIFLGTNDWWGGKPLGTITDYKNANGPVTLNGAFREIIDQIRMLNPEAKIILITPMKRVDFVYIKNYKNNAFGSYLDKNGQSLESFAEAVKAIATLEGFPVVDLFHQKKMDYPDLVKFKELKNPETGAYSKYAYPDFIDISFDPEKDKYPYPENSISMTYDGLHPSDKGYKVLAKKLKPIFKELLGSD